MIKYENYQQVGTAVAPVTGNTWYAQTFTPSTTHYVGKLRLWLLQTPTPTLVTVSIRDTTSGKPSGVDLVSASITVAGIPTTAAWVSVNLTPLLLTASQVYAIVLRSAGAITWWGFRGPDPAGTYAGGQMLVSTNAGVAWTNGMIYTSYDMFFEEWGAARLLPIDDVARVSSIRHIFRPGFFRMQVALGELGFDVDVAEAVVRKTLETAKEVEDVPAEPLVTKPPTTTLQPSDVTPPQPGELTDYAKRIMERPVAKAIAARMKGLRLGVEAVVTPYAIEVLRRGEQEAKLLMEIQRLTKAASADYTQITDYAREVLLTRIAELKSQLESSYRSGR